MCYSRVEERIKHNSRSFKGVQMRSVAFLCFFSFSTAALALDDCNAKFPNISQLEERLKCLQSNNNSLQSQVDALKLQIGGSSAKQAIAKPEVKPSKASETAPQPLTRADCKKAGLQWNNNANVCGR
jgi:peptidoglycan hydrolase CwlO-like protein